MKVVTRISSKEFQGLHLLLAYRKRIMITTGIAGLCMLCVFVACILGYGDQQPHDTRPYFSLVLGLVFAFVFPYMVISGARKSYRNNRRLQEEIEYEITSEHMVQTGQTFEAKMQWTTMYKIKELNNWFLVYNTPQSIIFIPKFSMTADEIIGMRNVLRIVDVKRKKLKKSVATSTT